MLSFKVSLVKISNKSNWCSSVTQVKRIPKLAFKAIGGPGSFLHVFLSKISSLRSKRFLQNLNISHGLENMAIWISRRLHFLPKEAMRLCYNTLYTCHVSRFIFPSLRTHLILFLRQSCTFWELYKKFLAEIWSSNTP